MSGEEEVAGTKSMSMSYSMDESFAMPNFNSEPSQAKGGGLLNRVKNASMNASMNGGSSGGGSNGGVPRDPQNPGPAYEFQRSERPTASGRSGSFATVEDSIDYSSYSEDYDASVEHARQQDGAGLPTVSEHASPLPDVTPTVHQMHRRLLYLLSHPDLFQEALAGAAAHAASQAPPGITAWDTEFSEDSAPEDDAADKAAQEAKGPTPFAIFASDAEVVLPQALTASQLFGIERITGIELEAAAGIPALSQLFLRWLALMPEGDHLNIIDPPGLTVMRIAGGRYRVTGAHRVVWRWMNKFSPASTFQIPSDATNHHNANATTPSPSTTKTYSHTQRYPSDETDFDFGDLVTMTIIDVFETDNDGKLLSYCPTFDNRAVHKTNETTERLRKGATHLMETMDSVVKSPAGARVNKAAGSLGKMSIKAAINMRNIVKNKIEEELHKGREKHQQQQQQIEKKKKDDTYEKEHQHIADNSLHNNNDSHGGSDDANEVVRNIGQLVSPGLEKEPSRDEQSQKSPMRGEHYFSDDSTAA